jgi:hypothetical protein
VASILAFGLATRSLAGGPVPAAAPVRMPSERRLRASVATGPLRSRLTAGRTRGGCRVASAHSPARYFNPPSTTTASSTGWPASAGCRNAPSQVDIVDRRPVTLRIRPNTNRPMTMGLSCPTRP